MCDPFNRESQTSKENRRKIGGFRFTNCKFCVIISLLDGCLHLLGVEQSEPWVLQAPTVLFYRKISANRPGTIGSSGSVLLSCC